MQGEAAPEHAPVQPANDQPAAESALSVTDELAANAALQAEPQLMADGLLMADGC